MEKWLHKCVFVQLLGAAVFSSLFFKGGAIQFSVKRGIILLLLICFSNSPVTLVQKRGWKRGEKAAQTRSSMHSERGILCQVSHSSCLFSPSSFKRNVCILFIYVCSGIW